MNGPNYLLDTPTYITDLASRKETVNVTYKFYMRRDDRGNENAELLNIFIIAHVFIFRQPWPTCEVSLY
jgi:hypothetical protein